jgi:hypothetical protein
MYGQSDEWEADVEAAYRDAASEASAPKWVGFAILWLAVIAIGVAWGLSA